MFEGASLREGVNSSDSTRRILIQGESGSGKTTLLRHVTSLWASGASEALSERFKFVLYVDASRGRGSSLLQTIAEQCVDARGYVISEDDVFNLLKLYQRRALLLIDGYEHIGKLDDDVIDVMRRAMFREACVVVTSLNSHVTKHVTRMFDARFLVAGLQTSAVERFISHYAHVTHTPEAAVAALTNQIAGKDSNIVQLFAKNPTLCMMMGLVLEQEANSLDITTQNGKHSISESISH